jgi:Gpi18-like mannosyltransferase
VSEERDGVYALVVYGLSRAYTFGLALAITIFSTASFGGILSRWDGGWYLSIVRSGYPTVVPSVSGAMRYSSIAFFPGYPLLVRAVSRPTELSPVLVGVVISVAAGAGAAVALVRLASDLSDRATARRTVVLFSFFPTAFVLSMVYADALFLFLAALCLLALVERRWLLAGVASGIATGVRPTAAVLIVCCLWGAIDAVRRRREWRAIAAPLLAPIGGLAYMAYLDAHTGTPTAFITAEDVGWGRRLDFGAWSLSHVFAYGRQGRTLFLVVIIALMLIGAMIGLWLMIRWRPPSVIVLYVVGVVALAALFSHPVSLPRYLMSAFPVLIPIADRLSERSYRFAVLGSAALLAVLFTVTSLSPRFPP